MGLSRFSRGRLVLVSVRMSLFSMVVMVLNVVVLFVVLFVLNASAWGEVPSPGWEVASTVFPTDLAPGGGTGIIEVNVYNVGAVGSAGTVTVTDTLPPGVVATSAGDLQNGVPGSIGEFGLWDCSVGSGEVVRCVNDPARLPSLPIPEIPGTVFQGEALAGSIEHIGIAVRVDTGVPGVLTNRVTVAGGGALAPASTSAPIVVSSAPVSLFGFPGSDGWFSNADGTVDTQAGSHPYEFTYSFDLNNEITPNPKSSVLGPLPVGGQARNVAVNLPPGFIGNPTAVPRCSRQQFEEGFSCPPSSQVGIDIPEGAGVLGFGSLVASRFSFPVFNMVPPPGIPAQFAFQYAGIQVFLDAGVRSGSDYGITVHANNVPQEEVMGNRITFWGEPSDPSHNSDRFSNYEEPSCWFGCSSSAPRTPFLTLPTACTPASEAPVFSASSNTWETAGFGETSFALHDSNDTPAGFTGCDHLGFGPSISVAPDTSNTDTPAGLTVDVRTPQEGLSLKGALETSNMKNTTVVLPQGLVINPGQAAGLQACSRAEAALESLPGGAENNGPASCPNASKVGTVQIATPLLQENLEGDVYVLQSNPPHLKLLLAATGEGVNIKLVLDTELNEQTGQITGKVINIPEFPVTDFKLAFSGGAQAALDTPTRCGEHQATSDFTPWSTPAVGDVFPSSGFAISAGSSGSACPSLPLPFAPSLTAGSTTDQAGGFTNFSLLLQRPDDQQRIAGLQFKLPPGLSGELSHIPLCTNAQAEANACPEASKIGHGVVESGPGPYPLVVPQPGQEPAPVYLTETYQGAPFGLSIVVPLHIGPFVLETQRVRARIEVDPRTAQLTVTTNPLPQEVAGVPTDLRQVDAVVERPEFMINPTNCNRSSFSGTATGTPPPGTGGPGTTTAISSPFQVGSCRSLAFSPKFTAKTSGKTSKANGASLSATLTYPPTIPGQGQATSQANIHSVKVELPKQLPSRLTTLQKACTAAQFNTNPAGCPPASIVGQAIVHTPVLPVPLVGPAYFVSHGGEAFPALVIVLQGYGITINIEAITFISKAGVTSLTFKTAPDAPFSSFTLTSPQGKNSALAANGNLCKSKLTMPTELIAQNGATQHQTTKITVTGCPKTKTNNHSHAHNYHYHTAPTHTHSSNHTKTPVPPLPH